MPNESNENDLPMNESSSNDDSQPTEPPSGQNQEVQSSAEELARKYVADQINQYYNQMAQQPPQYQAYQQPVTAQQPQPSNPDLWFTDPATAEANLKQQLAQAVQQYVQQQAMPLIQNSTEVAKHLSMQDPKLKEAWKRYGREIEGLVNSPQISPQFRASKAVWDQAASLVMSRHLDELVDERAAQKAAQMQTTATEEGTLRTGTKLEAGDNEALERIRNSDYGKQLLDKYGTKGVLNTCEKAGWSLDQYATMIENTGVVRHPDKPDEWKNPNLVRDYKP